MSETRMGRRVFLKNAGLATFTAVAALHSEQSQAQSVVPNSAGSEAPKLNAPANACDCHHHIFDPRFARPGGRFVPNARVADYRALQHRIRTTRSVVVTPTPVPGSVFVSDNQVTLDAIAQFGADARGIAIVPPGATDSDFKTLADGGMCGIRFTLAGTAAPIPATTIGAIEALSKRVTNVGWHVQFNVTADQIVAAGDLWNRLPSTIVFDHMGNMPQPIGIDHPAFTIIRRLVDKGMTWVKLSVTNGSSNVGPPTYADLNVLGRAYVRAAPERMVWGSNWPHPTEPDKPNDAVLFDLLTEWAPGEQARHRILVENPERLYGFTKSR